MTYPLTHQDYSKILQYYDIPLSREKIQVKKKAEKILAKKLCSCIKKVSPINEPLSIGVCTRNVFNRKQLKRGTFRCKKKQQVEFRKTRKGILDIGRKNKTLKH